MAPSAVTQEDFRRTVSSSSWLGSWLLDTATRSSNISSPKPVISGADNTHFLLRPAYHCYFPGMEKEGILKGKPYLFSLLIFLIDI